MIYRRIFF